MPLLQALVKHTNLHPQAPLDGAQEPSPAPVLPAPVLLVAIPKPSHHPDPSPPGPRVSDGAVRVTAGESKGASPAGPARLDLTADAGGYPEGLPGGPMGATSGLPPAAASGTGGSGSLPVGAADPMEGTLENSNPNPNSSDGMHGAAAGGKSALSERGSAPARTSAERWRPSSARHAPQN